MIQTRLVINFYLTQNYKFSWSRPNLDRAGVSSGNRTSDFGSGSGRLQHFDQISETLSTFFTAKLNCSHHLPMKNIFSASPGAMCSGTRSGLSRKAAPRLRLCSAPDSAPPGRRIRLSSPLAAAPSSRPIKNS